MNSKNEVKRVLHVVPATQGGGAELVAVRIAQHQLAHYEVHLVTWLDSEIVPDLKHHTVKKAKGGPLGAVRLAFNLRRLVKQIKPHIIISHLTYPNLLMHFIKGRPNRVPLILVHHVADFNWTGSMSHKIAKYVYSRNPLVSVSDDVKMFLASTFGISNSTVFPNPLALPRFAPPIRGDEQERLKLVAVGRLDAQKNYPFLLESLAELQGTWHLTIVGPGDPSEYKQLAQRLGMLDNVTFTGAVSAEDVETYLKSASVFVMTSDSEGEPSALLEAAALGLCVVGRDSPGLGTAVRKVGGFLPTNSDSPKSFALAINAAVAKNANNRPRDEWASLHDLDLASHAYCELAEQHMR